MLTQSLRALRPTVVLLLAMTVVLGLLYPAAITAIAQVAFPNADGSIVRDAAGRPVGSALIAQDFTRSIYFHPRPSAAGKGYDASASAGTNLAPGSKDLRDAIATRVQAARADGMTGDIPADLVTTSASGLDPDLSPESAFAQSARVAKARGLAVATVRALIAATIETPLLGIIGERHVNVLLLNRQLDALSATKAR